MRPNEEFQHRVTRRAEDLRRYNTLDPESLSSEDIRTLIHDLSVLQDELELQVEEVTSRYSRLEALYDVSPVGLIVMDHRAVIREINSTMCQMLGVEANECVGKMVLRILSKSSWRDFLVFRGTLARMADIQICRVKLQRLDEEEPICHCSGRGYLDESGKAYYTLSFTNITPILEVKAQLRKSQAHYNAIINAQLDYICRYTPDGILTWVNQRLADDLQVDPAMLIGKNFLDRLDASSRRTAEEAIGGITLRNQVTDNEQRIERPGKPAMWVHWANHGIFDDEGNLQEIQSVGRDVSDRKQAEIELRESESRYRKLFENRFVVNLLIDPVAGRIVDANPAAAAFYGWSLSELRGKKISAINTLPAPVLKEKMEQAGQHDWESFEFQHRLKDGSIRDVEVFSGPVVLHGHEYLYSYVFDITERKRTRYLLEDQERVLKDILEFSLSGYWDWNIPEGTEYLSPGFKKMLGYADHEIPNKPEGWQELVFPEDLPGVLDLFEQHVQSHGTVPFYSEVRCRHKDGSAVWVICSGRVIEWLEDGSPLRMVGCHVNITEQKVLETALHQSLSQLRSAQQIAGLGSWFFDPAVGQPEWSEEMYRIFERSVEDGPLPVDEFPQYFGDGGFEAFSAAIGRAIADGVPYDVELALRMPSGAIKHMHIIGSPLPGKGPEGYPLVGTIQDVSAYKALQDRLRQSEKMESLATLAAGIAHNFNNQLAGIVGYADLIRAKTDEDGILKYLDRQVAAAEKSHELAEQILAFSRLGMEPMRSRDVHVLLADAINVTADEFGAAVNLDVQFDATVSQVNCAARPCREAFSNVLRNAFEFGPEGAPVVITTRNRTLSPTEAEGLQVGSGEYLEVVVRDHGCGMSPDVLARVFDPFFSTKALCEATGMGLATAFGTARQHGGTLLADSLPGKGAAFTFLLPLTPPGDVPPLTL